MTIGKYKKKCQLIVNIGILERRFGTNKFVLIIVMFGNELIKWRNKGGWRNRAEGKEKAVMGKEHKGRLMD